jgi:hypothetical protein
MRPQQPMRMKFALLSNCPRGIPHFFAVALLLGVFIAQAATRSLSVLRQTERLGRPEASVFLLPWWDSGLIHSRVESE